MAECKGQCVPKLRFPGFEGEWEKRKLGDVADIIGGGTPSTKNNAYWEGDINWFSPAELGDKVYVRNSNRKITELGLKESAAKLLPKGTVLFTSRAGIGNTAILDVQATTNQGFQSIVPKLDKLDTYFMYSRSKELQRHALRRSAGSTFLEVSRKEMSRIELYYPSLEEQRQVGNFFKVLDDEIQTTKEKIEQLTQLKRGLLQQLFPQKGEDEPWLRFPGFTDAWVQRRLSDFLTYEQPTKYIVTNEDYDDVYTTPVLTAGKTFLLGYTNEVEGIKGASHDKPVIIFDDFTTNSHLVDFNFKVKSSALKILERTDDVYNMDFLYGLLSNVRYEPANHQRHWISMFSKFRVYAPAEIEEQHLIGTLFQHLDRYITETNQKLHLLNQQKQALLQQLFI